MPVASLATITTDRVVSVGAIELMFILVALSAVPVTLPVKAPWNSLAVTIPVTLRPPRVPTDVREELTTPDPKVVPSSTLVPPMKYASVEVVKLIFSLESQEPRVSL